MAKYNNISYKSEYKLNITDDQKKLLNALRQLNNFFTNDKPDTFMKISVSIEDVDDDDDGDGEFGQCYFCNTLCFIHGHINILNYNDYIITCRNSDCRQQFDILDQLVKNVKYLSHIPLPLHTIVKSNKMYLSVTSRRSPHFMFNKIDGLVLFATTTQMLERVDYVQYVPKDDDDHFGQMLKCKDKMEYYCDDFFPIKLRAIFD